MINVFILINIISCSKITIWEYSTTGDEIEFEEIDGNGYCVDSNGNHDVAKFHYKKMPHEKARDICRMDDGCVAYSYSLDNMLRDNSIYNNAIIYSNNSCSDYCGNDDWQTDSN